MSKKKVLFLCTHNSCRSQMAEGLLNSLYTDRYQAFSAGVEKTKVDSNAIRVMGEIGVDISKHYSKTIEEFKDKEFDFVITLCKNAKETCPYFPAKKVVHKNFVDPATSKNKIENYRRVRDDIKRFIAEFFE